MLKKRVILLSMLTILVFLLAAGYFAAKKFFPELFRARYSGNEILLVSNLPREMDLQTVLSSLLQNDGLDFKVVEISKPGSDFETVLAELRSSQTIKTNQPRLVLLLFSLQGVFREQQQPLRELAALVLRHVNRDGSRPRLFPVTLPSAFASSLPAAGQMRSPALNFNQALRKLAEANELVTLELAGLNPDADCEEFSGALYAALLPYLKSMPPLSDEKLPAEFSGRIVFQSDRSGTENIYLLDGSGVRPVTANRAANESPFFSPAGDRIVFESNSSGRYELYVHDLVSGTAERLFASPSEDRNPFWSKENEIYFNRLVDGTEQIFRFSFADGRVEQITSLGGRNTLPVLAPEADRLLMTSNIFLGWHVYWYELKDGKVSRFSADYGGCRARFSNRGDRVAWVSHKADGRGDVFLTPINDFQPVRLTLDDQMHDYYPCFSPDDRYIVYAAGPQLRSGNWDLKIVEISTRKTWQLTSSPARDIMPCWRY